MRQEYSPVMTTLQARTQGALTTVVDRPYTWRIVAITAVISLALGVAIGFATSGLVSDSSGASSSVTSVGGTEPRQGGR
jgi:predicted Abi (CAAX) family protease